jgi:hypothetical protein
MPEDLNFVKETSTPTEEDLDGRSTARSATKPEHMDGRQASICSTRNSAV